DILIALGVPAQNQRLVFSSYEDGSPKIITACEWKKGAKCGKHFLKGSFSPFYEGYYVEDPDKKGLEHWKSKKIKNGARALINGLVTSDRDGGGAKGDNKMHIEDLLFFIDPGLALREENPILDNLDTSFNFEQPFFITNKYKNFSAFTDNSITEKMKALYYLYWAMPLAWVEQYFEAQEINEVEAAIERYKEIDLDFAEELGKI